MELTRKDVLVWSGLVLLVVGRILVRYLNGLRVSMSSLIKMSRRTHSRYTTQITKHISGIRCLFGPLSILGAVIKTSNWNPGIDFYWERRNNRMSFPTYFDPCHQS